jgi:hypothetical protein
VTAARFACDFSNAAAERCTKTGWEGVKGDGRNSGRSWEKKDSGGKDRAGDGSRSALFTLGWISNLLGGLGGEGRSKEKLSR